MVYRVMHISRFSLFASIEQPTKRQHQQLQIMQHHGGTIMVTQPQMYVPLRSKYSAKHAHPLVVSGIGAHSA